MQPALRITTTVLPDNRIEVQLPPGSEGAEVEVFVVLPASASVSQHQPNHLTESTSEPKPDAEMDTSNSETKPFNIMEFLEQSRQKFAGRTAEEIDQQLQAERASWDS